MRKSTVLTAVAASSIAVAAWAHGGATGVVKERMDGMGAMKEAVKVLTPMMQGQLDYDADVVRDQAEIIAAHAGDALTALFPEGSLDMPSEAKESIWSKWEEFSELADRLGVVAEGLALSADNGLMMSGDAQGGGMMGSAMMGSDAMDAGAMGGMMGEAPGEMDFAEMGADGAFMMLGQVCSACHTQFRAESK